MNRDTTDDAHGNRVEDRPSSTDGGSRESRVGDRRVSTDGESRESRVNDRRFSTDGGQTHRVLVPVAVLEGETVTEGVAELLATLPVVVLGYHELPEQTAPGQARLQFEDRAEAKLSEVAAAFRAAGGTVETRLVFTNDAEQTIDRVAAETDCTATLAVNPTGSAESLLVAVGGPDDAERIASFAAALVGGRSIDVTLFHVARGAETDGEATLDAAATVLRDGGVPDERIRRELVASDAPIETVADAAVDHDAVVMGASAPSLRGLVFGEASDRVAAGSLGPVLVVRTDESAP